MGPGSASLHLAHLGATRQSNKCHKKEAGETQERAPLRGGNRVQVWSCAPCSARAPRGTKRLCRDPRGSRASSKAEHTKALRAARAPALAGGTQQWSDRGDPGAHTPSRRARIASRSRRSRAHSPWRVCGIPEIWTPGQRVGRRGTHLLLPGPSQDPKVQVSPPATD